jgi:putative tryptophan/tyrosine transport system substrate-binding protein
VISALARETHTIPIVFALLADPIGGGFAASLAHPGGNITGFAALDSALGGKWVGLLKELAPGTARIALLFNPMTSSPLQFYMPAIQAAASSLSLDISAAPVRAKDEIEGVISGQARNSGAGLIVMPDVFNTINSDLIISLAARYRVPTIYFNAPYFARSGGLITYGVGVPPSCGLHRPHPQGSQTGGAANPAADEVRAGDQSEDRQIARSYCVPDPACHRRRSDRVALGALSRVAVQ